jgi:hypothetical protein
MVYDITPAQLLADGFLILGYAFLGAAIKIIDEAYDTSSYKKETAAIIAVPAAMILAALIVSDPPSAAILLAIALAAAATHKLDNVVFQSLLMLSLAITAFYPKTTMPWLPFAVLTIAAIVDEYGNDWSDRRRKKPIPNTQQNPLVQTLDEALHYRPLIPVTAIMLAATGMLPILNLVATFALDLTYHTTQKITHAPTAKKHRKLQQT